MSLKKILSISGVLYPKPQAWCMLTLTNSRVLLFYDILLMLARIVMWHEADVWHSIK